jgi:hypothetical protein
VENLGSEQNGVEKRSWDGQGWNQAVSRNMVVVVAAAVVVPAVVVVVVGTVIMTWYMRTE